ncbi:MAG: hypothetical protein ABSD13_08405 [Candidatus Korobacteraceae bacterium]
MAKLDFAGRIAHGTGGVLKEQVLLLGGHQAEEKPGLGVVFVIILAEAR